MFLILFKSQNIPSSGMPKFHGGLMPPIPHHDPASIDCSTALLPYFYDFTPASPLTLSPSLSLSLLLSFSLVPCSLVAYLQCLSWSHRHTGIMDSVLFVISMQKNPSFNFLLQSSLPLIDNTITTIYIIILIHC